MNKLTVVPYKKYQTFMKETNYSYNNLEDHFLKPRLVQDTIGTSYNIQETELVHDVGSLPLNTHGPQLVHQVGLGPRDTRQPPPKYRNLIRTERLIKQLLKSATGVKKITKHVTG
jgi:hypothetical protein